MMIKRPMRATMYLFIVESVFCSLRTMVDGASHCSKVGQCEANTQIGNKVLS